MYNKHSPARRVRPFHLTIWGLSFSTWLFRTSNDIIAFLITKRYVLFFSRPIVCGTPQPGKPIQFNSLARPSKIKGWECAVCVSGVYVGMEKGLSKGLVWICQAQSSRQTAIFFLKMQREQDQGHAEVHRPSHSLYHAVAQSDLIQ